MGGISVGGGHPGDVAAQLAAIEARAARTMRVRRWTILPLAVVLGAVGGVAGSTGHGHRGHAVDLGSIIAVVVGVVVALATVVGVVLLQKRRNPAKFASWRRPPLTAGLPRQQRRAVLRDLRQGTPNSDPVLREVEERTVRRVLGLQSRRAFVVFPLLALVMILNAVLPDRTAFGRWLFGVFAVAVLAVSVVAYRRRKQYEKFPLSVG